MVPAGDITRDTIRKVAAELQPGDAIIDGGNTYYHDDIHFAEELGKQGIDHLDCGTSGGVFGLSEATADDRRAGRGYKRLEPIFRHARPGSARRNAPLGSPEILPGRETATSTAARPALATS